MAVRRINLIPSGTQIGSGGASQPFDLPFLTMAAIGYEIEAVAGSATPTINSWLQCSVDGGTTWFDVPYDQQLTLAAAGTDLTANTNKRNINGTSGATAAGSHLAIYKHLPAGKYRLNHALSGTSPVFTLQADLEGK